MFQYLTASADKRIKAVFILFIRFSQSGASCPDKRINTYRFIRVSGSPVRGLLGVAT